MGYENGPASFKTSFDSFINNNVCSKSVPSIQAIQSIDIWNSGGNSISFLFWSPSISFVLISEEKTMGNWDKEDPVSDWPPPSSHGDLMCCRMHCMPFWRHVQIFRKRIMLYIQCMYIRCLISTPERFSSLPNASEQFYINVFVYSFWTLFWYLFPLQNVRTSKVSRTEKKHSGVLFPHQPPKSIFFVFGVKQIQYWEAPHTLIIYILYMIVILVENLVYFILKIQWMIMIISSYPYHIMFMISIHGCQDPQPKPISPPVGSPSRTSLSEVVWLPRRREMSGLWWFTLW